MIKKLYNLAIIFLTVKIATEAGMALNTNTQNETKVSNKI